MSFAVSLRGLVLVGLFGFSLCPLGAKEPGIVRADLEPVAPQSLVVLRRGEQKIFKSQSPIRRLATSNPEICAAVQYDGSTLSLLARGSGRSDVTVWLEDASRLPIVWVVEVK